MENIYSSGLFKFAACKLYHEKTGKQFWLLELLYMGNQIPLSYMYTINSYISQSW